jgi:PAT family beta-lactamase induction signal transducer AmpG
MLAVVGLEVASGVPYALATDVAPVWLRLEGASLLMVGSMTLLTLPWTLKPLWAPLVDRWGSFRGWATGALLLAAAAAAWVPDAGPALALALLLLAVAGGTYDDAADGWIVAAVPEGLRGRAAGVRVAGYRGALALAGGGLLIVGDRWGWDVAFRVGAVALIGLAASIAMLLGRAAPVERAPSALGAWLRAPETWTVLFVAVTFKLGDTAMLPMVRPFWLDAGLTATDIGLLSAGVGSTLTAVGALAGGEIASRWGLRRALLGLGVLQVASNAVYAVVALAPAREWVLAAGFFESLTAGLGTAPFVAYLMRATAGGDTATRFAVCTGAVGLTRSLVGPVAGGAVASYGYPGWFGATCLVALPGLWWAARSVR